MSPRAPLLTCTFSEPDGFVAIDVSGRRGCKAVFVEFKSGYSTSRFSSHTTLDEAAVRRLRDLLNEVLEPTLNKEP